MKILTNYLSFVVAVGLTSTLFNPSSEIVAAGSEKNQIEQIKSSIILQNQMIHDNQPLGSVLHSLLTEEQIVDLTGGQWVLMKGQSISDSKLCKSFEICTLPDASGRFLRNQGGAAASLGQTQEDTFKSHNHSMNYAGSHSHSINYGGAHTHLFKAHHGAERGGGGGYGYEPNSTLKYSGAVLEGGSHNHTMNSSGNHTHSINNTGHSETKPKNLTVNMFIKIN